MGNLYSVNKATMIKAILSLLAFTMATAIHTSAQSYCVPPPFSSGPFTGILYVSIGEWEHSSPYDDGYMYFSAVDPAQVTIGENYEAKMRAEHTIAGAGFSGNLSYRIWIDWNQDGDFEDQDEEVFTVDYEYYTDTQSATFEVPSSALTGLTRMRVYNDMPDNEGHDTPDPCGYLNSTNPIGQHGEVEDYDIEVLQGDTSGGDWPVGILDLNGENNWTVRNEAGEQLAVNVSSASRAYSISVSNLLGQEIFASPLYLPGTPKTVLVDMKNQPEGVYIVRLRSGEQSSTKKVFVN